MKNLCKQPMNIHSYRFDLLMNNGQKQKKCGNDWKLQIDNIHSPKSTQNTRIFCNWSDIFEVSNIIHFAVFIEMLQNNIQKIFIPLNQRKAINNQINMDIYILKFAWILIFTQRTDIVNFETICARSRLKNISQMCKFNKIAPKW